MADPVCFAIDRMPTPIGEMLIIADDHGKLRMIDWTDHEDRAMRHLRRWYGTAVVLEPKRNPGGLSKAMRAYFRGDLGVIDRLPVATRGTPFQKSVWAALRGIRSGSTLSYGELARRIGRPAALRAVGLANGSNPISVVVPCHRVIGSDGTLTGYGGGLERKRWLLAHEGLAAA